MIYGEPFYVTAKGKDGRAECTHYLEEQLVTLKEQLEEKISQEKR